jgi:cytidylate kinase
MANTIPPFGAASLGAVADVEGDELFKAGTERVLREVAAQTGGVILGRAAAIVLAHHPGALHARLQGSRDGRLARTMANMSLSRDDASRLLDESDRSRVAYVKHFYRVDPRDPSLYHLLLDTTVIPDETCIDLITSAALARDPAIAPPAGLRFSASGGSTGSTTVTSFVRAILGARAIRLLQWAEGLCSRRG